MGMWVWDLLENTAYGSGPICEMTGLEPGTINQLPKDWLPLLHPEDAERVIAALEATRATGQDYHSSTAFSGRTVQCAGWSRRANASATTKGALPRVVGVLADVTHRKLTEEAMLRTEKLAVAGRLAASVAHEINNPLEAMGISST